MPDLLQQGGLDRGEKKSGIYMESKRPGGPHDDDPALLDDKVADFSYQSDALAQLIVDVWLGLQPNLVNPFGPRVTTADYLARSNAAKAVLAARGIYLEKPIVISEDEYIDGFSLADAGLLSGGANIGMVLVVPNKLRATLSVATPPSLLETAKMLMAVTPNGI
jgi:hypothetical protein